MVNLVIGSRVEVTGKGSLGTVAFIGTTQFATGKWIGVILDEPKGKNNGIINGKQYFQCQENHGTFVRQSQLSLIDDVGGKIDLSTSPEEPKASVNNLRPRPSSSRHSISGRSVATTPALSREDISNFASVPQQPKASFIEPSNAWRSARSTENLSRRSLATPNLKAKSRIPMTRSLIVPSSKDQTSDVEQVIETGFVETLRPQFTPGQALISPVMQAPRSSQVGFIDPLEYEGLKAQLQDVTEKLETIKVKHKEKIYEIDSLKLKLEQAAEFKTKIIESQTALKKELEKAKQEKQEAVKALEEMSDISDAFEMATLDKEMAEEKVEALQSELSEAKDKIEGLTIDLEIMKAEFEKIGSSGESLESDSVTSYQMKQLEQQNIRLRETLVRMRDLSAHEKHECQKLQKELEEKRNENSELRKTADKLQVRITELESLVTELHEQVDAALGAEEMVEQLGIQKLTLEEKVKELEEAVADLEALQDINDQLQEDSRELEMQLREEVDLANAATREALREKENALEGLADRELTIVKFRELVQKLREQCQDLQIQLQKESTNQDSMKMSIPEMLDFKKMFAETKAQARAIDLELRRMEVQQYHQHIQYLIAFMPDSFMARGGDNDAVLTLTLITRLTWKSDILLSQIKDKFPSIELDNRGELVKGHTAEQFASRTRFSFHIYLLQAILHQIDYGLNTCGIETFMKVGNSYSEMSQQEKVLDSYIDLLKTDQLDENVHTENLEKSVTYFNTMHVILLLSSGDTCVHQTKLLQDTATAFHAACDSIRTDVAIIQALIQSSDESDLSPLCQHLSTVAEVMQQHLKQIRRRISATPNAITLPVSDLSSTLSRASHYANKLSKTLRDMAKTAFSQIALTTDDIYLPPSKLLDIATTCCEKHFDDVKNQTTIACLKNSMNSFASDVANIAQCIQEAESTMPSPISDEQVKITPPVLLRAKQVKDELEQTKTLQMKLSQRLNDIKELKNVIQLQEEQIGELTVRKDMAEQKLKNIARDNDYLVEKLKRKLDEAQEMMKRKEKEFEETLDHLQTDIDSLELERGELKDKLKTYSKKVLIEGITKTAAASAAFNISSNTIPGLSSPTSAGGIVRESPLLMNEIKSLRNALEYERNKRIKIEAQHYKQQFKKLTPLKIANTTEKPEILTKVEKEAINLLKEAETMLSRPKVFDFSKRIPGTEPSIGKSYPANYICEQRAKVKQMQKQLQSLQTQFAKEVIKHRPGGHILTDLAVFPTPEMRKVLQDDEPVLVGEVTLPRTDDDDPKQSIVSVLLRPDELQQLYSQLLPMVA